ncbi:unnamed protein product [Prorocentrum cordatum]|uniref:CCHC-type domain-containing protein n=1 Tax=Prorocentrum cordatum TaxID=2364126 RepID=A0ABN9Y062_9DINO|nr:unnamed protein product [Polarella glacialis]
MLSRSNTEIFDEDAQGVNTNLYYILVLTCKDKAQGIVKSVAAGEGLEAWILLCVEFEPKVPSRFSGMLDAILYPMMQEHVPIKGIVSWETMVQGYEEQTGEKVMESIKKSVISTRLVPQKLRAPDVECDQVYYVRVGESRGAELPEIKTGGAGTQRACADEGKDNSGDGYDQRGAPQCKYCLKKGHARKECRKATQDIGDGKINKDGIRRISKSNGKGEGNNDKTKAPTPKPTDKDASYWGPDYDAEEGCVFMVETSEDEEFDHNEKLDHNGETEKEPNYDEHENDESVLIPINEFYQEDGGNIEIMGVWLDDDGGAVLDPTMRNHINELIKKEGSKSLKLSERRGIYSFDVGARSLCPLPVAEDQVPEPLGPLESEEAQLPRRRKERCKRAAGEIATHERTHMPFRDWCEWCLWGRGKWDGRMKANPDEAPTMSVSSLYYCFVNAETGADMVATLVMVQKPEDCAAAIVVIHKGPSEYVNSAEGF